MSGADGDACFCSDGRDPQCPRHGGEACARKVAPAALTDRAQVERVACVSCGWGTTAIAIPMPPQGCLKCAGKVFESRGQATALRVAFAGASGTGKSTLAERVSRALGFPLNPVGSRSVARAMGFENPYDVDAAGRRAEFQRRLAEEKVGWEARQPAFVTDRTTADQLAYQVLHDVRSVDQAALDAARVGLTRYTHVFLCPVDAHCDPAGDPARVPDLAYHRVYEALLTGLLARLGARLVVLEVGSLSARIELLRNSLGGAKGW